MATKKQLAALKRGREIRAAKLRGENHRERPARKQTEQTMASGKETSKGKSKGKSKGTGKSKGKRKGGGGGGGGGGGTFGLSQRDTMIALGTVAAYGHLQAAAADELKKDAKAEPLLLKVPTISAIGRAATLAVAAYAVYRLAKVKIAKPIAIGMAAVAVLTFARRGFKTFDDKEGASIMSGVDELALPSGGGGAVPEIALAGELNVDGTPDQLSAALARLNAA